ncbi:hypothetical protein I5H38_gp49 [Mycobacterium phage Firehouse51]|uniref:Uncharacterized protein n=1 Tax=Mycobacterium phage Firehouse51 TaxID=2776877 RepID=A0A7M1CKT3_9CAUD|nr:hypothetical protein I5H38_gp49 [Mycobacterium phage Firehouse51]QOP65011.1 hypothetical protein SEA_FIREHOUSE51_49 [Mycobacterium phage Firehouse51]
MTVIEGEVVEEPPTSRRRERNAGRVLDVLPPSRDEKLAAMSRMTPEQQVDHVTELLVHSHAGLLVAIAAQDLPGIAEAKRKAATIQEIVKQLRMGKDMRLHADEFVRRAERGLGVAIREGQERGDVRTIGERAHANNQYGAAANQSLESSKPGPRDFATPAELGGANGSEGIYAMTDGVSDEAFEEALAEARAEGNLSRANVARKAKAKAQRKEPINADDPLIDADMQPPPAPKWPFKNTPTEFLAEITGTLAASAENIKWITAGAVAPDDLAELTKQARDSWALINKHLKEINRHVQA